MRKDLRPKQWEGLLTAAQAKFNGMLKFFARVPPPLGVELAPGDYAEVGLIDAEYSKAVRGAYDVEFRCSFTFRVDGRLFQRVGYETRAPVGMDGTTHGVYLDPGGDDQECLLERVPYGENQTRWKVLSFDYAFNPDAVLARVMHPYQPVRMASLRALEWMACNGQLVGGNKEKAVLRLCAALCAASPDLERWRIEGAERQCRKMPDEPPAASAAIMLCEAAGAIERGDIPEDAAAALRDVLFNAIFEAYTRRATSQVAAVVDVEKFKKIVREPRDLKPRMVLRAIKSSFVHEGVLEAADANR